MLWLCGIAFQEMLSVDYKNVLVLRELLALALYCWLLLAQCSEDFLYLFFLWTIDQHLCLWNYFVMWFYLCVYNLLFELYQFLSSTYVYNPCLLLKLSVFEWWPIVILDTNNCSICFCWACGQCIDCYSWEFRDKKNWNKAGEFTSIIGKCYSDSCC